MKLLSFSLSLLFLGLTLVPCDDLLAVEDDCQNEIHLHALQGGEQQTDGGADFCSPICSCHCCHFHYMGEDPVIQTNTAIKENHQRTALQFVSRECFTIWQPPQLI